MKWSYGNLGLEIILAGKTSPTIITISYKNIIGIRQIRRVSHELDFCIKLSKKDNEFRVKRALFITNFIDLNMAKGNKEEEADDVFNQ
ncbi:hypothetical protein Glove_87g120 [Diversispora epigaea]|uniref:Uncharacterized protein n=1 Tax=Diversispora epigaea TaxID=1348612 RepID=A0A397J658_9GLOM|nr:hypothetical protein Glove_87g120 [Diversispora epigaea]